MAVATRGRTRKAAEPDEAPAPKAKAKKGGGVQTEISATEEREARDAVRTKEIIKLRDKEEKSWDEIGEEVGISAGRAIFLYDKATVEEDELIPWKTEAELGKKLLKLRVEGPNGMSWGKISARTDPFVGEGKLKSLHAAAGGEEGSRIGMGGRHPGNGTAAKKPAVRTRTKAKAAAEETAAPKTGRRVRTRSKK